MKSEKLYVVNVSHTVSVDQLEDFFGVCGDVVNVEIIREKMAAIVEFTTNAEAESAREKLNGKKIGGNRISIKEVIPEKAQVKVKKKPKRYYEIDDDEEIEDVEKLDDDE